MPKQETWGLSLGQGDRSEKEIATHSTTLAKEIPWTEEPGDATLHGVTESPTATRRTQQSHTPRMPKAQTVHINA